MDERKNNLQGTKLYQSRLEDYINPLEVNTWIYFQLSDYTYDALDTELL